MSFKTDLHIHSWHSDGALSPVQLVEKYSKDEYDLIALTDHEVVTGYKEAMEEGKDKNLRVIPGIEFATLYDDIELHILGYYFDPENQKLLELIDHLAKIRTERNKKMLAVFRSMGYDIEEEDLIQREGQTYIGKPHFAQALINKGYIESKEQAFSPGKFIEAPQVKAVERPRPKTQEVIEIIKEAGGMAVLAHPYKIKNLGQRESQEFKASFDSLISQLKSIGLKGIECIYPEHSHEEELFFIDTAAKYHLHITEGSDFHGNR